MNQDQNFKVWWDEKNQIIRSILIGNQKLSDAKGFVEQIIKLMKEKREGGISVFSSINDATEANMSFAPEIRKVYTNFLIEGRKGGYFNKTAIFGLRPTTRMIVNFLIGFSGDKSIKFFDTEKNALKWIEKK